MVYVISKRMYREYTKNGEMTHQQLVEYLNKTAGIKGGVTEVKVR